MKDEYYQYIKLFLLSRADYYYMNGYYSSALILYTKALKIAKSYKGERKAIHIAIVNINKRILRSEEKEIQRKGYHGNYTILQCRYFYVSILGFVNALCGKTYYIY